MDVIGCMKITAMNSLRRKKTFSEAVDDCQNVFQTTLASVMSLEEDNFLRTKLMEQYARDMQDPEWVGLVWIGGVKQENTNSFKWMSGEKWGYEGWEASQPANDRSDDAVTFWWNPQIRDATWKWKDTPMPAHHSFICKSYLS